MSLTPQDKAGNVDVTSMEDRIDQAARRTAINLMRLNEALEHRDAEVYSEIPRRNGHSPKYGRLQGLEDFYRKWFTGVAVESEAAEEVTGITSGVGTGSRRLENMEDK